MLRKIALLLLLVVGSSSPLVAQGLIPIAAQPLQIQPSVRANGLAGASVASPGQDATAVAFNPAHLGIHAMNHYVAVEFYPVQTKWLPNLSDRIRYHATSVVVGYNFNQLIPYLPVSAGAGYSRLFIDLGTQIITGEDSPEPIGIFDSWEQADVWSVGIGLDYILKAAIGWNFKRLESHVSPLLPIDNLPVTAWAHDYGIVVHLPVLEAISRLRQGPREPTAGMRPFLTASLAYSKSNINEEGMLYSNVKQPDPLPRIARDGFGLQGGIESVRNDLTLRLLSLAYLSEAEQLLVRRDFQNGIPTIRYAGGDGDINFFSNVLLWNSKQGIVTRRAWELQALELLALRLGFYRDRTFASELKYTAFGAGITLSGIFKYMHYTSGRRFGVVSRVLDHLDFQFNYSRFFAGDEHPLDGTEFLGLRISFF